MRREYVSRTALPSTPSSLPGFGFRSRLPYNPRNGEPATFANGGTIGFRAASRDAVRQFHATGLANGGTDEGVPGPRPFKPTAYAAYLRDPDGNKICAYCFQDGE